MQSLVHNARVLHSPFKIFGTELVNESLSTVWKTRLYLYEDGRITIAHPLRVDKDDVQDDHPGRLQKGHTSA